MDLIRQEYVKVLNEKKIISEEQARDMLAKYKYPDALFTVQNQWDKTLSEHATKKSAQVWLVCCI